MKSILIRTIVLAVALVCWGSILIAALRPRMNTQSLYVLTDSESHETLRVALLSDLHVKNSPDAIADLAELWSGGD